MNGEGVAGDDGLVNVAVNVLAAAPLAVGPGARHGYGQAGRGAGARACGPTAEPVCRRGARRVGRARVRQDVAAGVTVLGNVRERAETA
jgi:hypothetical protein